MMKRTVLSLAVMTVIILISSFVKSEESATLLTKKQIPIRDPFIVVDRESSTYYMYAQTGNRGKNKTKGVEVYTSKDLKHWTPPVPVLSLPQEQQVNMVWAPEVHYRQGKYYMFVTLTFGDKVTTPAPVPGKDWPPMYKRGTWIFRADSPKGPFLPLKQSSHTPADWMALDGTFWEENGVPYMIFCHEWVQLIDGSIDLVELKPDLSDTVGTPRKLFAASFAPGAHTGAQTGKVTDGPFLYKSPKSGTLYMIWSTFVSGIHGYCVFLTHSESGQVAGPWSKPELLYEQDGGHGMIFTSLEGKILLAIHQPNVRAKERLALYEIIDTGKTLKIKNSNKK